MRLHIASLRLLPLLAACLASAQPDVWTRSISSPATVGLYGSSYLDNGGNVVTVGVSGEHSVVAKTTFNGQKIYRYQSTTRDVICVFAKDSAGDIYVAAGVSGGGVRLRKINGATGAEVWNVSYGSAGYYDLTGAGCLLYTTAAGNLMLTLRINQQMTLLKFNATDGAFVASSSTVPASQAVAAHPSGDLVGIGGNGVFRVRASDLAIKYDKVVAFPAGLTSGVSTRVTVGSDGDIYLIGRAFNAGQMNSVAHRLDGETGNKKWSWSTPAATSNQGRYPLSGIDSDGGMYVGLAQPNASIKVVRLASANGSEAWGTAVPGGGGNAILVDPSRNAVFLTCSTKEGINANRSPGLARINRTIGALEYASIPAEATGADVWVNALQVSANGKVLASGHTLTSSAILTHWVFNAATGAREKVKIFDEKKTEGLNLSVRPASIGTATIFGDSNMSGWTFERVRANGTSAWRVNLSVPPFFDTEGIQQAQLSSFVLTPDKTSIFAAGQLGSHATLVKLSADTGETLWRSHIDATYPSLYYCFGVVSTDGGDALVFVGNSMFGPDKVARVRGTDGAPLWLKDLPFGMRYLTPYQTGQLERVGPLQTNSLGDVLFYNGTKLYQVSRIDGSVIANRDLPMAGATAEIAQTSNGDTYLLRSVAGGVKLERIKANTLATVFSVPIDLTLIQSFPAGVRLLSGTTVGWVEARKDGSLWVTAARATDGVRLWSARMKGISQSGVALPLLNFAGGEDGVVYVSGTITGTPTKWFTMCIDGPKNSRLWISTRSNAYGAHLLPLSDGSVVAVGADVDGTTNLTKAIRHSSGG